MELNCFFKIWEIEKNFEAIYSSSKNLNHQMFSANMKGKVRTLKVEHSTKIGKI